MNNHPLKYFPEIMKSLYLGLKITLTGKPIIIKDWNGVSFWQYKGDKIRFNLKRKSVTDAQNVIKYIAANVQKGWTCVDIGANIGAVSVYLWKYTGNKGKVFSIEADPNNIERIKNNLEINHLPSNKIIAAAIADRIGKMQLRCYPDHNGWQTLGNPSFALKFYSYLIEVPSTTFENIAIQNNLKNIDLIKIDVEGAELLVLNGMKKMLEEKRIRKIIFEVNPLMLEGMNKTVNELLVFWEGLDYTLFLLNENGEIEQFNMWPDRYVGDCIAIVQNE